MQINDDHMYHGAALTQIAEHGNGTAISPCVFKGKVSRCAFWISRNTAVYLKYRTEPEGRFEQYSFKFSQRNLSELRTLAKQAKRLFLGLICVADREICCLLYDDFRRLIALRKQQVGGAEEEYRISAALPGRSKFRIWIDEPGKRGVYLEELRIARGDFPQRLFA